MIRDSPQVTEKSAFALTRQTPLAILLPRVIRIRNPIFSSMACASCGQLMCPDYPLFSGGETGSTEVVKHWLRTEFVASRKKGTKQNLTANTELALAA